MARRAHESQRTAAENARGQLMEDFRHLDSSQRTLRGMVERFRDYLPERAASSGLVPRFEVLDREAEALMAEYLQVLDQHPLEDDDDLGRVGAAHRAYADVGPRLAAKADELDQVVLDYDAELTRIGRRVQRARDLRDAAGAHAGRVAAAAGRLRELGLDVPELADLLARTRAAAATASTWEPVSGFPTLEAAVAELEGLAAAADTLAADYPARIARATTRRTSLRTVAQAVESRLERVPDDMAVLRREFSLGNFSDLEDVEKSVDEALAEARTKLHDVDRLVDAGAGWSLPLRLLDEARAALDRAKERVDAPAERLAALRAVRSDPEDLFRRLRSRLRDAQLLVVNNPKPGGDAVGRSLDDLGRRLDGLRPALQGVHPVYWSVIQEGARIEAGIKQQVERFRSL